MKKWSAVFIALVAVQDSAVQVGAAGVRMAILFEGLGKHDFWRQRIRWWERSCAVW